MSKCSTDQTKINTQLKQLKESAVTKATSKFFAVNTVPNLIDLYPHSFMKNKYGEYKAVDEH
jgi:hypothetical protein